MNQREKSLVYSLIFILPFLWSFLFPSDLSSPLKLHLIVPAILSVFFIIYIFKRRTVFDLNFKTPSIIFAVFSIYMITVSTFAGDTLFAFKLILILATAFSLTFLGIDVKYYNYIGYVYALMTLVIISDFNNGGLTSGWNTNSISLIVIKGVYLLFLAIELGNKYGAALKITLSAILLFLISFTGSRSIYFGFAVFLIVRYLILNKKDISKTRYIIICLILISIPYITMRIYMALKESSFAVELDKITFELTDKNLFTEREIIWEDVLKKELNGYKFFFGNGIRHANAHNIFIDIIYSYGIFGVALYASTFICVLSKLYKHHKDPIIKTCISSFFGMIAMQSFETTAFGLATQTFDITLYMFLAIAIGRYIYIEKERYYA